MRIFSTEAEDDTEGTEGDATESDMDAVGDLKVD